MMAAKRYISVPDYHHNAGIPNEQQEIEKSTQGHAVPSFSIFKQYSTDKVETLKSCFIKNATLEKKNLPARIVGDDGFVYTAVYDSQIPANMDKIPVVISFQKHTYGRFAVIRVVNEAKRRKF